MMQRIYTLLLMVFLSSVMTLQAQESCKMNISLYKYWKEQPASNEVMKLLVKGNIQEIKQFVAIHGGLFKYAYGDIAAVELPMNTLSSFTQLQHLKRVEGMHPFIGRPLDDQTDTNIHLQPVRVGTGLPKAYDGSGVIMGFVDTGIDFTHPDFKNPSDTTKTRILYIWDQNVNGAAPTGYSYGTEWDSAQINSGSCTEDDPSNQYGHGTNVAGAGAGNGRSISSYMGVAPKADIITVATLFNNNFLSNVLDGVKYIFDKADALGEPCVINISEGDYSGAHDGRDLYAQMLDSMIAAHNGHMVVCAAGNAGPGAVANWHMGYTPTSTPQYTFFNYTSYYGAVVFEMFMDSSVSSGFQFALGSTNSSYTNLGSTGYYNFNGLNLVNGNVATITGSISGVGSYTVYVQAYDSIIDAVFFISPAHTTDYWRLITKGSGRFDIWSSSSVLGTSDMLSTAPAGWTSNYVAPDTLETTVGYFAIASKALTVANYNNRNTYTSYSGTTYVPNSTSPITVGNISTSSSVGPTRLGRVKPDIASPGDVTMAPSRLATAATLISTGQGYKVSPNGKYNRNGGTSLASPIVAGTVALFLQEYPTATWSQIREAILLNTTQDSYTGTTPNNTWGYGKLNAYNVMLNGYSLPIKLERFTADAVNNTTVHTAWVVDDQINNIAFYVQRSVDGYTFTNVGETAGCGTCHDRRNYSLDDTKPISGTSYYRLKQVDIDGHYTYSDAVPVTIMNGSVNLDIYPNPITNYINLHTASVWQRVDVSDALGRTVYHYEHPGQNMTIDAHTFSAGVYFCSVVMADGSRITKKIIVSHDSQ